MHVGDRGPFGRERREQVRSDGNVNININGVGYVARNERFIVFVVDRPCDSRFSNATLP